MHECKGRAIVKLTIELPISGAFNGNYRSGTEELEECAGEAILSFLPQDFKVVVDDVTIKDYQLLGEERDED
jgi:hypothetical protein